MMFKKISSSDNPFIRQLLSLDKARERKKNGHFVVEGLREISLAADSHWEIEHLLFSPDIFDQSKMHSFINDKKLHSTVITQVSEPIFRKLTYRDKHADLLAVVRCKTLTLEHLSLSPLPLVLILESVEKPGNIGAILRTADAAGVDALIICDPHTDIHNPNVVRSGLGALFTVPIAVCSSHEAISWCRKHKLNIIASSLRSDRCYTDMDFRKGIAMVMGSEAEGISELWANEADHLVKIPMHGKIDSLNVSNAAAILIFEVLRQRRIR